MKITIIGTGYVGLVSGACFASSGADVTCVDKDKGRIEALTRGESVIYEKGLDALVAKNMRDKKLRFTTHTNKTIALADVIFIAVGTPQNPADGHADLRYVHAVVDEITPYLDGYTVIAVKSTVPVGICREILARIRAKKPEADIDLVSNPEFLREGSAVEDFMNPDRIVVGCEREHAAEVMRDLYRFLPDTPFVVTSLESSELIKYASNAFLALKISYVNQMADLCERLGADIRDVAKGMGLDARIGAKFLQSGPGYGGSCFPKDTAALIKTAESAGIDISLIRESAKFNIARKESMASRVITAAGGSIQGKSVAILGLAFKSETNDTRDSAALWLIPSLLEVGASVKAYDPEAMQNAREVLPPQVHYCSNALEAMDGADITVIVTEWKEFADLAPKTIASAMRGRVLVDLRHVIAPCAARGAGLILHAIGHQDLSDNTD